MTTRVAVDLHIHTALSPCAADAMTPPAILLTAETEGVAVAGIVDHNSARNAPAIIGASQAFDVRVFVGLEIESIESVHVLTLFDDPDAALAMDALVASHLPSRENRVDLFGEQILLDEMGDPVGSDPRLLAAGTDLRLSAIVAAAEERGGIAIPAHIDRSVNGLLPTLGFLPPDLTSEVLELSRHIQPSEALARWPSLSGRGLINSSDAHYITDIGRAPGLISGELAAARLPIREWGAELARELREARS